MKRVSAIKGFFATSLLVSTCCAVLAQETNTDAKPTEQKKASGVDYSGWNQSNFVIRTYRIVNMTQQSDANEILVALRNILIPTVHIYMDFSASTIVLAAPVEQQQIAQSLIEKLDIQKQTYRLTYTLTELEDGKKIGTQHYSFTAADGQRVTLKQGSKVPLVTGGGTSNNPQFQYIDVGMNFDVVANTTAKGVLLKSKVEQSSVPEEKTISGVTEPVIRQAVFEGSALVPLSRPFILGSTDVVGSNRRIDVEVVAEAIAPVSGNR